MEITLCDYDFTDLYAQQSAGYTASPQLPEISQYDLDSCGAAFYIEPVSQLSGSDDFTNRVRLQSLWSRATSPYISRFCAPISDLPNSARYAAAEWPRVYLLLDDTMQYMGYVTVTDGERVKDLEFPRPSGVRTGASLGPDGGGRILHRDAGAGAAGGAPGQVYGVSGHAGPWQRGGVSESQPPGVLAGGL